MALGAVAAGDLRAFLDRLAGVVALVCLSVAVMLGLATALRGARTPGGKVAGDRAGAVAAATGWGGPDAWVALGTLACHLFLLAFATGVWRGVFAARRWIRPFRILHGASYAGWAAAVVHGLTAGREPAAWVVASYALCLAATAAVLVRRLLHRPG
jgi:hypothetical protein